MKSNKIIYVWLFLLIGIHSYGQLNITPSNTPPYTPQNLISNVFLGSGVEVNSILLDGDVRAVGYFEGGLSNLGLERGIVMSTGRVSGIDEENLQLDENGEATSGNSVIDVDLENLANAELNDIVRYTITFTPTSDTLRFRYVFASEEYPDFVCQEFNDVFGFFISGPNPSGGNYISRNIALVPDPSDPSGLTFTNTPVSINNVHSGFETCTEGFPEYYNTNPIGTENLALNAYLDVFTAEAIVVPCEQYTIKLAIGDAADNIYNSAVFLEAKSFGTGTLRVSTNSLSVDGSLAEGCTTGELIFSLPEIVQEDYNIDFTILNPSNSATPDVDYPAFPSELIIPAGSNSISVPLEAFIDGELEGEEVILFEIQVDVCNRRTFEIILRDDELLAPILPDDVTICEGESLFIDAELDPTFELPPSPNFKSTGILDITPEGEPVYSDIFVSGVLPTVLGPGMIENVCITGLEHIDLTDLDIFLIAPGGQFLELSTDNGAKPSNSSDLDRFEKTCFNATATENINRGNNLAGPMDLLNPTYTGEYLPEGNWSDLTDGNNPANGTWRLMIIDDQPGFTGILEGWTISFKSFYNIEYIWTADNDVVSCIRCQDIEVSPDIETIYTLTILDSYGCERSEEIKVSVAPAIEKPTANCNITTQNSISIDWNDVPDRTSYEIRINGGAWVNVGQDLNYTFNSLVSDSEFEIEIRALGAGCNSLIETVTCATLECTAPKITVQDITETTCPGGNDGTVVIIASGDFPPFEYDINGITNNDGIFTTLEQGENVLSVTDNDNCIISQILTIPGPEDFSFEPSYSLADPCNVSDGINGNMLISGGTGPYDYLWSNGSITPNLDNLSPGEYQLSITDSNNCTASTTLVVPLLEPLLFQYDFSDPLCYSENNGTATFMVISGEEPINVIWNDGSIEKNRDDLSAGEYNVTISDGLGCSAVETIILDDGPMIAVSVEFNDVSCVGSEDGTAVGTIIGGTSPFQYFWDGGTSNGNMTEGLAPGSYNLFVEDANGCRDNVPFEIKEPLGISLDVSQINNLCSGTNQGRIDIAANSPQGSVNIEWDDGNSEFERVSLATGTYCFTLTDGTVCSLDSCIMISEPAPLIAEEMLSGPKCAEGTDGFINLEVTGGSGNYNFQWEGPISGLPDNAEIVNLPAGMYTVTVSDVNNCQVVYNYELFLNAPINYTSAVVNVKCFGDSTGEITFDASGGEPPYTYEWTGPNGFTGNTSTINNIEAGNYELIFTDDGGCVSNYSFEVMQPSSALKTGISPSDSICYGTTNGLLQISPSGGDGPYDVLWSNGHNGYVNENLAAGIYLVSVSDNDGCIAIDQQEVVERGEINVNISQTPSRCFGSPDGTAIINSVLYGSQTASISDFEYLWNSVPVQTNSSVTGLIGGETYTVIVTDINQCSGVETVIIESPESISAEIIALQNVNCFAGNDGSIDIRGTGGTGQFSYLWDISANSQTTSKAEMLKKGNYSLTITDSNQCTGVKNFTVEEPLPLSMDFNVIDVSCYGESAGRAEADVEGGVGPYEYSWSNGSNAKAIENVISEQYLITITDANACTLLDSVTVLEPESPIMSDVNIVDVQCFDGSNGKIEIESMGGSGFYQYSINGNEFFSSSTISNLSAGTYDIYVKDFKGCFDTLTNIILNQPPEIIVDLGADKIIPYGSTVNLIAEIFNTSGNVEYSWFSDNLNLLSCTSCPNPTFEGIREASFELVIYDENGCKGSDFITVRLENYSSLQVPSAFTPNNDGENDILLVFGNGIKEVIHFKIFDRWGELVYENADFQVNDEALGWDGKFKDKDAPSGIYYWFAEVEFDNGFKDSYNGNTSLLR